MIFRDPELRIKNFFKQDVELHQKSNQYQIRYYALARQALGSAMDCLGIQKGDNIFLPAYICQEAVVPITKRGIGIKYYHIDESFSPDFRALEKDVNAQTKAVVWVNYFGLMNNVEQYQQFCQKNGLRLIEDSAHGLALNLDSLCADASIFSLRKFYPASDGAMLVLKEGLLNEEGEDYHPINSVWTLDDYKFITGKMLRKGYAIFANEYFNKILLNYKKEQKPGKDQDETEKKVSRSSLRVLKSTDIDEIFHHRRYNYRMLKHHLFVSGKDVVMPFTQLTDDYCPLAFPLLIKGDREEFIRELFLKGFVAYGWPDLPKEILTHPDYPAENKLAREVVLLPIHQSMSERKIIELAEAVNEIGHESNTKA